MLMDIAYVDIDNIKKVMALSIIEPYGVLETTTLGTRSNASKYKVDCVDEKQTWLSYAYF